MKRAITFMMSAAMLLSMTGNVWAAETESNNTSLAYTGVLTLSHFSTSEESEGNGGSDGFRTMIAEWQEEHPEIDLQQNILAADEYRTQISTQAAAGDLPDVCLLEGMYTKSWASQGLIMDMTDIIKASPYYEDYKQEYFVPFTDDDKIYGLPCLTGGTCAVVIYDKEMWEEAGYDEFPSTWDELVEASSYFNDQGITTMAFGNGGQWQMESDWLSVVGDRFTGSEWFQSIIDKTGAAFTDEAFVEALKFTQDAFMNSGVFNADFNAVTNEDAREYYISGDAAAFLGGNWDESYIAATLLEDDEEKYDDMGFAVIPQPTGAENNPTSQDIGLGFAICLNSKLADDPDKLASAIDLAYKLTGEDFSNYVGEKYALSGLTQVEGLDLSAFDQVTQDFYNFSYVDTQPCEIYDSYVDPAVWSVLEIDMQAMVNGDLDPQTVAEDTQQAYEENYLNK